MDLPAELAEINTFVVLVCDRLAKEELKGPERAIMQTVNTWLDDILRRPNLAPATRVPLVEAGEVLSKIQGAAVSLERGHRPTPYQAKIREWKAAATQALAEAITAARTQT